MSLICVNLTNIRRVCRAEPSDSHTDDRPDLPIADTFVIKQIIKIFFHEEKCQKEVNYYYVTQIFYESYILICPLTP